MRWVPTPHYNGQRTLRIYVLADEDGSWIGEINNVADEWRFFVNDKNGYRGYRHVHTFETHRALLWALEHPDEMWMELLL